MRRHCNSCPALIVPLPALVAPRPGILALTPLPVNRFHDKLAPNVPKNMLRNRSFCSFASFQTISLTFLINEADSSRDLSIFIILCIFSFEINNGVIPEPKILF